MSRIRHLTIVGAGPAGTSLAIRLAQKEFSVCLIERDEFPREKLCGEFISPECFRHFRELGVFDEMLSMGGERISETFFYAPGGKFVSVPSEWFNRDENALSLSRAAMDFRLLKRAKELGVEVLESTSVVNLTNQNDCIGSIKIRAKNGATEERTVDLLIDATGRTAALSKIIEKQNGAKNASVNLKSQRKLKLVGFKAHLENAQVKPNACEIYFFRGGYGGLSFVENNRANFCFLMRADVAREFNSDAKRIIEKLVFQNKRAAKTLKNAVPINRWLAVAVDSFGKKDLRPATNLFAIGDAGAFIDPFTGSGMLMALESAEILANAIVSNVSVESIARQYEQRHARHFQRRLFVCSLMRRAAFSPVFAETLISALSLADFPRKILARATRTAFSDSNLSKNR